MVVEYLLLLSISIMILAGAFGLKEGPVGLFKENSPYLARLVEIQLETGEGFKPKANWQDSRK